MPAGRACMLLASCATSTCWGIIPYLADALTKALSGSVFGVRPGTLSVESWPPESEYSHCKGSLSLPLMASRVCGRCHHPSQSTSSHPRLLHRRRHAKAACVTHMARAAAQRRWASTAATASCVQRPATCAGHATDCQGLTLCWLCSSTVTPNCCL